MSSQKTKKCSRSQGDEIKRYRHSVPMHKCYRNQHPNINNWQAKQPSFFRISHPSVPNFSQCNAWLDDVTFQSWLTTVFIPLVRHFTSKHVAFIMENCGLHGKHLSDHREQVSIFTLPPNCTSLHQLINMGILQHGNRGIGR